jgi:hypothetical protein
MDLDFGRFWYRYKNWIIFIGIFIMLVVLGLVIRSIILATKAPKSINYKPVLNANGEVVLMGSDGKPLDPLEGFDPVPFAYTAKEEITKTCWVSCIGRCKVYENMVKLTDNQLIAVANKFKQLAGESILSAMGKNVSGCNIVTSSGWQDWDDILKERLMKMGLV